MYKVSNERPAQLERGTGDVVKGHVKAIHQRASAVVRPPLRTSRICISKSNKLSARLFCMPESMGIKRSGATRSTAIIIVNFVDWITGGGGDQILKKKHRE